MSESWKDLVEQLMWEMNPQDNYHGSGAIFNKFNKKFIGSGQGAKTHGYGLYSADDPITGARYVLEKGKPIELNGVETNKIADIYNAAQQGIDIKLKSKYLYNVNVPNTNFLLDESLPLNKQSNYVQRAIRSLANDLPNKKFYINAPREIMYNMGITDKGRDFYNDLVFLLGRQEKSPNGNWLIGDNRPRKHGEKRASELLNRYGIKGIRAYGLEDGPINVTFSDDNIRMANTPWQRFTNRIPKQTLGKMANKIITNPAFKSFVDASPALGVGLEYLEPLDIIMSKNDKKKQKIKQMFNDAVYEVEIQPDGTYLFKM